MEKLRFQQMRNFFFLPSRVRIARGWTLLQPRLPRRCLTGRDLAGSDSASSDACLQRNSFNLIYKDIMLQVCSQISNPNILVLELNTYVWLMPK